MKRLSKSMVTMMVFLLFNSGGAVMAHAQAGETPQGKDYGQVRKAHITIDDSVDSIIDHPAFTGFSRLILPRESDINHRAISLNNVRSLMPYHGHVNPTVIVGALNHMIDDVAEGKTIFYDFYSEQQKRDDPSKNPTGLFFFRGKPGAPFAVVCPGGGFSYVGSLHEGFPLALEISEKSFNAFVIRYRIGSQRDATEDLAAAVSYIVKNAAALEVSPEGYSLWGGSAGARMVGDIALDGIAAYRGDRLPKPSTAVIAYTGQATFSKDFPPTFITISTDDGIAPVSVVDRRVENLRQAGVTVEYLRFRTAGHGFGLGTGTDAQGWLDQAVRFWQKQL